MPTISGYHYTVVSLGNSLSEAHQGTGRIVYNSTPSMHIHPAGEDIESAFVGLGFFGYGDLDVHNNPSQLGYYIDAYAGTWVGLWAKGSWPSYAGPYSYGSAIVYLLLPVQHIFGLLEDELDLQRIYMMEAWYYVYLNPNATYCNVPSHQRVAFNLSAYSNFRFRLYYAGIKSVGQELGWLSPSQLSSLPIVADIPVSQSASNETIGAHTYRYTEVGKRLIFPPIANSQGLSAFQNDLLAMYNQGFVEAPGLFFTFVLCTDMQATGASLPQGVSHAYAHLVGYPLEGGAYRYGYNSTVASGCAPVRGSGTLPYYLFPSFVFKDSPNRGTRLYSAIEWRTDLYPGALVASPPGHPLPESLAASMEFTFYENKVSAHSLVPPVVQEYTVPLSAGGYFSALDTQNPIGPYALAQWKPVSDPPDLYASYEAGRTQTVALVGPSLPILGRHYGLSAHYEPLVLFPQAPSSWGYSYGFASFPYAGEYPFVGVVGSIEAPMRLSINTSVSGLGSPVVESGISVGDGSIDVRSSLFLLAGV